VNMVTGLGTGCETPFSHDHPFVVDLQVCGSLHREVLVVD